MASDDWSHLLGGWLYSLSATFSLRLRRGKRARLVYPPLDSFLFRASTCWFARPERRLSGDVKSVLWSRVSHNAIIIDCVRKPHPPSDELCLSRSLINDTPALTCDTTEEQDCYRFAFPKRILAPTPRPPSTPFSNQGPPAKAVRSAEPAHAGRPPNCGSALRHLCWTH